MRQLRLNDISLTSLYEAALHISTKVAYQQRHGYRTDINGETFWQAAVNINPRRILRDISDGYQYDKLLLINRWTGPTKQRKIYISTWRDKVLDYTIYRLLTRRFRYTKDVYAYRERFGIDYCHHNLRMIVPEYQYYIKRDISNYFYSIDHGTLFDKLSGIVDPALLSLIKTRVQSAWVSEKGESGTITLGVPFGTSISCALANIYLDSLDKLMISDDTYYVRYADDLLVLTKTEDEMHRRTKIMSDEITRLKLEFKPSSIQSGDLKSRVKFLGLLYNGDGKISLPLEKQQKIIRIVDCALRIAKSTIRNSEHKVSKTVEVINKALTERCRGVAIVDYYLKHVNNENQLKSIDRIIKERAVCAITGKWPFRKGLLRTGLFEKLRDAGLVSLLHRSRLLQHKKLKRPFMSLLNTYFLDRHIQRLENKREAINIRKMRKSQDNGLIS